MNHYKNNFLACLKHWTTLKLQISSYLTITNPSKHLIHDKTMSQKTFHEVFPLVILIFSLFFKLLRLRDQSQIVDLIFPLRSVASTASETSKVPHS